MDSNPSALPYQLSEAEWDGMLTSSTNQQQQQDEESVTEPPSFINVTSPEDMSCASSVTTRHFYDAELFGPSMYPSVQNLHDSSDAEDPTFQPVARQTKTTMIQPALPPLQEELSQDPNDSKCITASHQKINEKQILKEQEKATTKEESRELPSMASLESKINQKTQLYSVRQISTESNGDTGIDSTIQKEHREDERARNQNESVDSTFHGKGRSNPVISKMLSLVNEGAPSSPPPKLIQEFPMPIDLSSRSQSAPGAHAVQTMPSTQQPNRDNPISGLSATLATENLQQQQNMNSTVADEGSTQPPAQESLAEARPVAATGDDLPVAKAEGGNRKGRQQSNWPFYLMGGLCILLVVAAIIIGAVCGTGSCSQKVYVDGSSTMAPTTTRDAVEAPKIEIALAVILGKEYFHHVEGSGEGNDNDTEAFMLETRQKAFDWIVNKDPIQLEFDAPNLVQRFLLVLFYFQTTRHQPWKECNPPATPQRSASGNFCYTLDPSTGDTTSSIWGDQWLSASHECQWAGMICEAVQSKEKTVVGLRMTWNQLNGPLPWEMARLPHLKQLFLSHNMLSGMLPPKLLSFSLESLHLGNNQLSGPLPARWFETLHDGNAKLINLQISSNRLTGTIPSELGISPLKTLGLRNNSLTGSLPLDLFHMGSFKSLDFVQNDLTGTLPSEIGLLTHLKYIFLSHTGIAGTLPSEIGLATQLHEIFASYSNMEGTIPEEVYAGLTELIALALNDCNFSGTISSSLGLLTDLVWLHVANNNFHGTIPNEIGALTELRQLVVNGNQLTGTVPVSVCHSVAYIENYGGSSVVTADCLPNPGTGVPTIGCDDDCCTSCCDNTGVCLAN